MCKVTGSELIFIGVETHVQSVCTFRWKCNLTKKAKTDTFNNRSKIKALLLNQTGNNYEYILKQQERKRNKYFKQI